MFRWERLDHYLNTTGKSPGERICLLILTTLNFTYSSKDFDVFHLLQKIHLPPQLSPTHHLPQLTVNVFPSELRGLIYRIWGWTDSRSYGVLLCIFLSIFCFLNQVVGFLRGRTVSWWAVPLAGRWLNYRMHAVNVLDWKGRLLKTKGKHRTGSREAQSTFIHPTSPLTQTRHCPHALKDLKSLSLAF